MTLLTVVAVGRADLAAVVSSWATGKQTSAIALWGLPMLWWGRIGKIMQFFAGCIVVLDLVGPDRLRAAGTRAAARLADAKRWGERMREQAGLTSLVDTIEDQVITEYYPPMSPRVQARGGMRTASYWRVRSNSMEPPTGQIWFNQGMLDELRERVVEHARAHTCRKEHDAMENMCLAQHRAVQEMVREFALSGLPPRERELLAGASEMVQVRRRGLAVITAAAVAVFSAIIVTTGFAVGLIGVAYGLLAVVVLLSHRALGLGLRLRAGTTLVVTRFTARLLDRTRPGHSLRWVSFLLFIAGFGFDLAAS